MLFMTEPVPFTTLAIVLMLTLSAAPVVAADALSEDRGEVCDSDNSADCRRPAPKRTTFKPLQRIWQCNDIRVTETVMRPWTLGGGTVVNYDLGGTIWGGSQFLLNVERGDLYFNGRLCARVLS